MALLSVYVVMFQHTAARRRLALGLSFVTYVGLFQHTAARRRLLQFCIFWNYVRGFNTQPPEGGWAKLSKVTVD